MKLEKECGAEEIEKVQVVMVFMLKDQEPNQIDFKAWEPLPLEK